MSCLNCRGNARLELVEGQQSQWMNDIRRQFRNIDETEIDTRRLAPGVSTIRGPEVGTFIGFIAKIRPYDDCEWGRFHT